MSVILSVHFVNIWDGFICCNGHMSSCDHLILSPISSLFPCTHAQKRCTYGWYSKLQNVPSLACCTQMIEKPACRLGTIPVVGCLRC